MNEDDIAELPMNDAPARGIIFGCLIEILLCGFLVFLYMIVKNYIGL